METAIRDLPTGKCQQIHFGTFLFQRRCLLDLAGGYAYPVIGYGGLLLGMEACPEEEKRSVSTNIHFLLPHAAGLRISCPHGQPEYHLLAHYPHPFSSFYCNRSIGR